MIDTTEAPAELHAAAEHLRAGRTDMPQTLADHLADWLEQTAADLVEYVHIDVIYEGVTCSRCGNYDGPDDETASCDCWSKALDVAREVIENVADVNAPGPADEVAVHLPANTADRAFIRANMTFDPSTREGRAYAFTRLAHLRRTANDLEAHMRVIRVAPEHAGR